MSRALLPATAVVAAVAGGAAAVHGIGGPKRSGERKHDREELELYRLMVKSATDYAIFRLDPEGRIASWNTGAECIKGYNAEDVMGRHFSIFYPSEAVERAYPEYELEVAQAEGRFEDEGWRVRKDGTQFWANVVITALRDERGRLVGFSKITRDLSERKRAERSLTAQYEVSRLLAESLSLEDAGPLVLRAIGEGLDWDYGALWTIDWDAGVLRCEETWHAGSTGFPQFEAASRHTAFPAHEGLPGSVWVSGEPRWVADTASEPNFPRLGMALSEGLRSGFGLPIILSGRVVAVMEFLCREPRPPDPSVLEVAAAVGSQIGQFIERTRAEEAVRESEARQAGILESALDAIITMDREGKIVEFNPAAERMFGYDRAGALGREMAELIIPASLREQHRRGLARYLATGEGRLLNHLHELTAMRADGSEFPVELIVTRIHPGGQQLFTGFVRDITERKLAEEERERLLARERAAREQAVDILESISDAFFAIDKEGRFIYVNSRAEQLWERPRDRLLGRDIQEEFPQAVGSEPHRQILRAAQESVTTEFESVSPVLGIWIAGRAYPSPDGVSVYFRDVTERKQAEERLQARARQQEAVAELGTRALESLDLSSLMDEAVALVARTLGVEYCKVLELLPGGDALLLRAGVGWREGLVGRATVGAGLESQAGYTLASKEPVIVEDLASETRFSGPPLLHEHRVASGMSVIILCKLGPFGVLGAHTTGRRSFTRDDVHFLLAVANVLATAIERRESEEELARERGVAERLEELEQLRAQFVRSISHELRTPLTGARVSVGMVETSAGDRLRPTERRLLGNARQSIEVLGLFIDDLLAYSQMQAGGLSVVRRPVDLRGIVSDALSIVGPLIEGKGQQLWVELSEPLLCDGDPRRLEQVVVNLLSNAHHHTPRGTHIAISGRAPFGEVLVSVADNGPGIPEAQHEDIFREFYQAGPGDGGSGLGLAISKGIVELHGGRIWVESEPGKGATFHVALPRVEEGSEW